MTSIKRIAVYAALAVVILVSSVLAVYFLNSGENSVKISAEAETAEVGDTYSDGVINSKDAVYLLQYLSGIVSSDNINFVSANTYVEDNSDDGTIKVNSRDAVILLQYLAKMDVTLGVGEWYTQTAPTESSTGTLARKVASGIEIVTLPEFNTNNYTRVGAKEATCTQDGYISYYCNINGQNYTYTVTVEKFGHTVVTDEAVAATCTTTGLTEGSHCSVCGEVLTAQQTIEMIDHDYSVETWQCTMCGKVRYTEYTSYSQYSSLCNVSESNSVVTLLYNSADSVGINLNQFALESSKTYVFEFGSKASEVKISGGGYSYGNVRIVIDSTNFEFDLVLDSVSLSNKNTVITSNAAVLNLGCYGSSCSVSTTKGSTGSTGASYSALQVGNGGAGGKGGNANVAVVCSGTINIICGANTTIKGGDGGNGGAGGSSNSSGSTGGTGGNGGDGAMAITADQINVSFVLGMSKSNISIKGGSGGSGGAGGYGTGAFWFGTTYASDGSSGSSALATNVDINYID